MVDFVEKNSKNLDKGGKKGDGKKGKGKKGDGKKGGGKKGDGKKGDGKKGGKGKGRSSETSETRGPRSRIIDKVCTDKKTAEKYSFTAVVNNPWSMISAT